MQATVPQRVMDNVATSQLRHNVPGTLPLDRAEEISRDLESSDGRGGQREVSEARAEEDSDSGNSLFLTQADATSHVAGGSGGQPHCSGEDVSLLSSSYVGQCWRKKKYSLPTFNFPFLKNHKRRLRRTPFPDQNRELHHYMIGGFFKCLGELRGSCQREKTLGSSLPTVDMDGEHISPLSEEDEERSEDEDVKVVARKYFVSLSTKKSKQNWSNKLKKQDRGKGTNAGKPPQTQSRPCILQESSDNGKSSCNVLDQKERKARDGNFLATPDTQKTRCLAQGNGNVSFLQKASEEGQKVCKANDAGVLEFRRSSRHASQKGRQASEPVTGQECDGPGSRHLLHGHRDRTSVSRAEKRKKNGPRAATSVTMEAEETLGLSGGRKAAQTSEVAEMNGKNGMGDLSRDGNTLRQEEGDTPDSKQKRKKNESSEEGVGQEDGNAGSEVRVENDGKKKRRKGGAKDVEHLQPSAVAEPPNGGANVQKEKKKELGIVMTKEPKAEGALNRIWDLPAKSTEQLGGSVNCLEHVETSQETSRLCFVKRKKDKKKQQSFFNDAPDQRKEGVDLSFYLGDSVTTATGSRATPKKKRTIFEEINDSFYTEKKKKSEIVSGDRCEDSLAQNDDSASTRKKEKKKKKSSFLVADIEENYVQTHRELEELEVRASDQEELNNGVTDKNKKRRKMSVVQDSVEKNPEGNRQEQGKTRRKRKKKHAGSESEGLDGASDAGFPPLEEASELNKKQKRCYDVMEEDPLTAKDGSTHDEATTETPGNQALEDTRITKKKKLNADRGESAESECRENQEKQSKSAVVETSDITRNKHGKLKRKLFNPNEEFFAGN
ncbi:uncharacterized protein AB9W97_010127 [Spinachia spinachia]